MMKTLLGSLAGVTILAAAASASAAVVIDTGANGPANKNVDWAQEAGGDNFVYGVINNTSIGVVVEGAEDIKTSSQGGVVWIVPTVGSGLDFLRFSLDGYDFSSFEVDLKDPTGNNDTWSVTILTNDGTTETFNNFNGGFINAYGTGGTRISSVEFQTSGDITGVGQVRFGGAREIGVVPEPATWAMMIMGFGAAGALLRRRQSAFA
ncbi:hypothetical protein DJ019_14710 [Phenylobacterium kunshanense]|uniref:Ice-binding protein C-terminal domain-containing protein n=1 Tax=Phenylobacterium kunshanense TaxID=1445034 RepID=A0A328BCD8_9CAUL|nr:PEPxxWA-CTERM sorting domain-containing protein [Phenylobacterium kunshanense]RAK64409.1 hypothetical protein DJ019_14710 [Phenylobacterium kunshanense]